MNDSPVGKELKSDCTYATSTEISQTGSYVVGVEVVYVKAMQNGKQSFMLGGWKTYQFEDVSQSLYRSIE